MPEYVRNLRLCANLFVILTWNPSAAATPTRAEDGVVLQYGRWMPKPSERSSNYWNNGGGQSQQSDMRLARSHSSSYRLSQVVLCRLLPQIDSISLYISSLTTMQKIIHKHISEVCTKLNVMYIILYHDLHIVHTIVHSTFHMLRSLYSWSCEHWLDCEKQNYRVFFIGRDSFTVKYNPWEEFETSCQDQHRQRGRLTGRCVHRLVRLRVMLRLPSDRLQQRKRGCRILRCERHG